MAHTVCGVCFFLEYTLFHFTMACSWILSLLLALPGTERWPGVWHPVSPPTIGLSVSWWRSLKLQMQICVAPGTTSFVGVFAWVPGLSLEGHRFYRAADCGFPRGKLVTTDWKIVLPFLTSNNWFPGTWSGTSWLVCQTQKFAKFSGLPSRHWPLPGHWGEPDAQIQPWGPGTQASIPSTDKPAFSVFPVPPPPGEDKSSPRTASGLAWEKLGEKVREGKRSWTLLLEGDSTIGLRHPSPLPMFIFTLPMS